jgi:uncharacterized membrane protein YoaK (UPF0700 family)
MTVGRGMVRAARKAPVRANGRAKTVNLNWIISSSIFIFFTTGVRISIVCDQLYYDAQLNVPTARKTLTAI